MDTSYQNIRTSASGIPDQPMIKAINKRGYLVIALGTITLIGSLVATGYLYSQLGYTSFAIGGAGVIVCILSILLSKYRCGNTVTTNQHNPQLHLRFRHFLKLLIYRNLLRLQLIKFLIQRK